jgi:hypothetical protein
LKKKKKKKKEWIKLRNEKLNNFYSYYQNIIGVIKARRMRWVRHWTAENLRERDSSDDLGVDSRMILKWL